LESRFVLRPGGRLLDEEPDRFPTPELLCGWDAAEPWAEPPAEPDPPEFWAWVVNAAVKMNAKTAVYFI
jgi:hypothetical protein